MDQLVSSKNTAAIQELKAVFGLEAVSDIRDFAYAIGGPSTYLPTLEPKTSDKRNTSRQPNELSHWNLARTQLVPSLQL